MTAAPFLPIRVRSALLLSCAATAWLAPLEPAAGQAFQGDHMVAAGAATRMMTSPTTETIIVESPFAILNWAPADVVGMGPVDFLPAGNIATFQNDAAVSVDFVVLNRILPQNMARPVALNGVVLSRLQTLGGGTETGGTVAFFTPAGLIIGSTAVFDIGNLLLTTIDPTLDAQGNFFVNNSYSLSGKVDPTSGVVIQNGASVSALEPGSYVAVAAPQVRQGGVVRVNGSTAYVAAESVTLTINNGLFDIQVKVGSSSAPATLIHGGSTGGPASLGAGDNQAIYMVAVPKDMAISLLLRGNVGYDAVAGATEENGAIILSAGYNIDKTFQGANQPNQTEARIDIRQADISSDLIGFATTSAVGTAFAGQILAFAQDVALISPEANLGSDGGVLTVGDDAGLTNGRHDDFGFFNVQGGKANLFARNGGSVTIADIVLVNASARAPAGLGATGGDAIVSADGGSIAIGGTLRIEADADQGADPTVDPGNSLGGNAGINATAGGTVNVAGAVQISAAGRGGTGFGVGDAVPGTGTGGNSFVSSNGANSAVTLAGALTLDSSGEGGSADSGTTSGGTGGETRLAAAAGGRIAVAGATQMRATGLGGTGVTEVPPLPDVSGGSGAGGTARILADAGTVQLDTLVANASGTGGPRTGAGLTDGTGTGGLVQVISTGGTLDVPDARYQARGFGAQDPATLNANGNVVVTATGNPITGAALLADSGGGATFANIRLSASFAAAAEGTIRVIGPVAAPAMTLRSRNIDIPGGGSLGGAATTSILLDVIGTPNQSFIGGAASQLPGYRLDDSEISRLRGDAIRVAAPATGTAPDRPPDILVDDVTLARAVNANANPFSFRIDSGGTMRVAGEVRLTGAQDADSLSFNAPQRIEVITPEGGIHLLDAAGNPGGTLRIASANVAIADAALAAQLVADPNFAGRDAALLANNDPLNLLGPVRAGGVAFTIGNSLFVKNSGAADDLAGITVAGGGLTIAPVEQQPAIVVGFGRRLNPDGSFTTGDAFFGTIAFDRSDGAFTDDSEFNLCNINSGACPRRDPIRTPTASVFILGPLNMLEERRDPSDVIDDALGGAPLIEEPVTSGGDGSFWAGDDDDDDDEDEE